MWPKMRRAGKDSISGLLPGLVALSCLSAGWLLGYGLSHSTDDFQTSQIVKRVNGKFLTNVPAYRQDWARSNDERTIKNSGFGK